MQPRRQQPWRSHSNAICNHRFKKRKELRTQAQPLFAEHRGGTNLVRNDRSRTRRTHEVPFIPGCNHFTRKNTRFRAPASSPKQSPGNINAAITIRFAASRSKPALYTHDIAKWQQSCSHSSAICNHRFKKRKELRTQEQPLVAEHRGGTDWPRNDPNYTRRAQEVPFIAGCSHFTQKNTRFRAPASSPTQAPCNIHASQFFCDVLLSSVKSHTTLHQGQFFCDVLQCSVKLHTTLHQGQVSQFYLSVTRKYCFPTSLDYCWQSSRQVYDKHYASKQHRFHSALAWDLHWHGILQKVMATSSMSTSWCMVWYPPSMM